MSQDLIIRLAKATRELDKKYTPEELLMMVYYDEGSIEKYICAVEVINILDKYNVEVETYMHYMYDNDIMWDTIREEVDRYDGR